jgi:hypothetical protein
MPDATWATLDLAINEDLHLLSTEGNRPSLPSLLRPERPPERKRRETGGGNPTLKPRKKREKVGERMSPGFSACKRFRDSFTGLLQRMYSSHSINKTGNTKLTQQSRP